MAVGALLSPSAFAQPVSTSTAAAPIEYFDTTLDPAAPGQTYNFFGYSLSGGFNLSAFGNPFFDVNGDFIFEFAAGAGRENNFRGSVSARDGVYGDILWKRSGQQSDVLGRSVAVVSDVTGDGIAEVLAGATQDEPPVREGIAVLLDGSNGQEIFRFTSTFPNLLPGSQFGIAVAPVTDIDGDGYGDFVISELEAALLSLPARGCITFFRSRPPYSQLFQKKCGAPFEKLGKALVTGRFFGNVHPDLAVGVPRAFVPAGPGSSRRGRVEIYRGTDLVAAYNPTTLQPVPAPANVLMPSAAIVGPLCPFTWEDDFGGALGKQFPITPNGNDFVIVGAQSSHGFAAGGLGLCLPQSGAVYTFDLMSSTPTQPFGSIIEGGIQNENFGAAVSETGDMDGDGFLDIGIGNPSRDTFSFTGNGQVSFHSSTTHNQISFVTRQSANNAGLGAAIAYGFGRGTVAGEPGIIAATGSLPTGHLIGLALDTNISGDVNYSGVGCTSPTRANLLTITSSRPIIGQTLTLTASHAAPGATVWFFFIIHDELAQPFLIPQAINQCIVPGINLNLTNFAIKAIADSAGRAVGRYRIANDPNLVGLVYDVLSIEIDPSGFITSGKAISRVGTI